MKDLAVIYSSDVSIEDHANMVVFKNDNDIQAIFIERYNDTDEIKVYYLELYDKPSDSWINKDDIKGINNSCDTDYSFEEELKDNRQYLFTQDLCWYYGANNFDSFPDEYKSQKYFEDWLLSMNLI